MMKTLVIFYSYTGHTRAIAQQLAAKESAGLAEVKDRKRPGKVRAYSIGCLAALRGQAWPVQPLDADLADYDRIMLLSPVWAGNPPPAVNAVLDRLPAGKMVEVQMISTSGRSGCRERLEAAVQAKGGTLKRFTDIKA